MSKKMKKQIVGIVTSIVVIATMFLLDKVGLIDMDEYLDVVLADEQVKNQQSSNISDSNFYEIVRVVDGDTFVIDYNGKNEKVRLIGVDTPESVHPDEQKNTAFGNEVSSYSKRMLMGKRVQIEFDVEKRDKYGRLLAYVYIDGQMYNKLLLERGYAKIATYPPNVKYVEDFKSLQKQARENKVGLWSD